MRSVTLAEATEINPSGPRSGEMPSDLVVDFVPMAAVSERGTMVVGERRRFADVAKGFTAFQRNDVLVAKITPCFENNKIVVADVQSRYAFGSTEFHVLRCIPEILDPRYLFHFLRQDCIRGAGERRMTGSAGQRRVPKAFLERLLIPLPSFHEQRRIAAILDQADELQRNRREALDKLEDLRGAVFFETFVREERDEWQVVRIADIASDVRTGPFGSQLLHSEFVDEGIAVLGIDNAVNNEFRWSERRYITEEKYRGLRRYTVRPGDVLITIMGTCGRCAVVPENIPLAINTKHLCCITLDATKALPPFLHAVFLQHPAVLKQLGIQAKGAVMPGLNMGIIKSLELRLPPLEYQQAFVSRLGIIDEMRGLCRVHADRLGILFASLQHRAFNGELSSKAAERELAEAG